MFNHLNWNFSKKIILGQFGADEDNLKFLWIHLSCENTSSVEMVIILELSFSVFLMLNMVSVKSGNIKCSKNRIWENNSSLFLLLYLYFIYLEHSYACYDCYAHRSLFRAPDTPTWYHVISLYMRGTATAVSFTLAKG